MTEVLVLIDPGTATITSAPLDSPQLPVTDLSAHRGDGVFETVLVHVDPTTKEPTVVSRERHFARFHSSASALDLPEPDRRLWRQAVDTVVAETIAANPGITEFGVRYSLSRGGAAPRGWAFSVPIDDSLTTARAEGVRAVSIDRGYPAYLGRSAPWLLIGAKTLSYAVNQAAIRHAKAQGVEEVLFVSHDGVVLEGPTSNIIIRRGDHLLTPDPTAGLLAGTTQRLLFDHAGRLELRADFADLSLDDVHAADGAWLVSSMRTAVTLRELDGRELSRDEALTREFQRIIAAG